MAEQITIDKTKAQQVLEALIEYVNVVVSVIDPNTWTPSIADGGKPAREAIIALRQAIEQAEKQVMPTYSESHNCNQEPVAWLCTPDENGLFGLPLSDKGCKDCFPVYRHPPQRTWVDLSDEDIEECFTITPDLYLKRHIAQRILNKFKEKNNG